MRAARMNAFWPLLFVAWTSDNGTRNLTHARSPPSAACIKAVEPSVALAFGSISVERNLTQAAFLPPAAAISALPGWLPVETREISATFESVFKIGRCPISAAKIRGVLPREIGRAH